MIDRFGLSLCQMQGHMFELSAQKGMDSEAFVKAFMNSDVAADLDKSFNHTQWAGEAYLISRLSDESPEELKSGNAFDVETMYWSGYLYRYWHFYTGESSKAIFRQAPISLMRSVYLMYHAMSIEMAIDRLKESYVERGKENEFFIQTVYQRL